MQLMRFGRRAPERWPILQGSFESHSCVRSHHHLGSSSNATDVLRWRRGPKELSISRAQAGRILSPSNVSPIVTKRHNSINSLFAMAATSACGAGIDGLGAVPLCEWVSY